MNEKIVVSIFGFICLLHAAISLWVLNFSKNVSLKKKFFPSSIIAFCLIFASAIFVQFYPNILPLVIFSPFLVIIAFLNIKLTKFCDKCEKFRYNSTFYEKMEFCLKCGDKFK
jgi:hypothetical protein